MSQVRLTFAIGVVLAIAFFLGVRAVAAPSPPDHLAITDGSRSTCGQHGGFAALFCKSAYQNGYLILVWDYKNQATVEGYRVYDTSHGKRTRIATQSNNQLTLALVAPNLTPFAGRCFVVTAFQGGEESRPSKELCLPGNYREIGYEWSDGFVKCAEFVIHNPSEALNNISIVQCGKSLYGGSYLASASIRMGYEHQILYNGKRVNAYWRSAWCCLVWPKKNYGTHVSRALLELNLPKEDRSCYGGVAPASHEWHDYAGSPDFNADFSKYPTSATFGAKTLTIDVTKIVQDWARSRHATGFVFRGTDENPHATDSKKCLLAMSPPGVLSIWF
jgi:hypothetical protein